MRAQSLPPKADLPDFDALSRCNSTIRNDCSPTVAGPSTSHAPKLPFPIQHRRSEVDGARPGTPMIKVMNELGGLWFWAGVLVIFVGFGAVMYRVGNFTLMPGERKQLALSLIALAAVGVALSLVFPSMRRLFGSSWDLITILLGLGSVVLLVVGRQWRRKRLPKLMQERPQDVRDEYESRAMFMRSRQGRFLTIAAVLTVLLWSLVTTFVGAPSRSSAGMPPSDRLILGI